MTFGTPSAVSPGRSAALPEGLAASTIAVLVAVVLGLALPAPEASASDHFTQEIILHPGWNAIHLLVDPEIPAPASVFGGLPIESVWTWGGRESSVQFLVDPAEVDWHRAGWLGYRTDPAEAVLNDLHAITGGRAYLIELAGSVPVIWSVRGRPSLRPIRWLADAFNLVGLPIDPASSITLGTFLAPSAAHAGQAVYALDRATGRWQFVDDPHTHAARAGEAYWVYCRGPSSYQGPWTVAGAAHDGIDFGFGVSERRLTFSNTDGGARFLSLRALPTANPIVLGTKVFDPESAVFDRPPLDELGSLNVPSDGTTTLTLVVRREAFAATTVGSVLELTDGLGLRRLIPVRAKR